MISSSNSQPLFDFSSMTQCGICFENYNDTSNRPMVLECGHTICHGCLIGILNARYTPKCPFDKRPLKRNINSFSVNYSYLELIAQLNSIAEVFAPATPFPKEEMKKIKNEVTFYIDDGEYRGEYIPPKHKNIRHGFGEMKGKDGSVYLGYWMSGKKNGRGIMKHADGREYDGEWFDDLPHGQGKCMFTSGEVKCYEGGWRKGKCFGFGKITYADGTIVETVFKDDLSVAEFIKKTNPNGSIFFGKFEKNSVIGKAYEISSQGDIYYGTFTYENHQMIKNGDDYIVYYQNGKKYEGAITNNVIKGKAKIIYDNGDIYEGEIVDGLREGTGETTSANGSKYVGEYHNDERSGAGKYTNGKYAYDGNWKEDLKDGTGFETLANGETYCGEFKRGKKEGKGVYIFNSGDTYKGDWRNDKMDGKGYIITRAGVEIYGEFQNGMLIDDLSKGPSTKGGNCIVF